MASLWSPWGILFMVFMACFSSLALSSSHIHVQYSTISAAPAFLPSTPLASSPSLPPDIEPLFPTPKGMAPSPTDSSLPTIPSSPSPPNPDNILDPGPGFALSPSDSLPNSTSVSLTSARALKSTLFLSLLVLCLLQQLSGV
ncbi:classical arabinogalactan protein 26-like [Durio zibethinus]|uniref:Classical arabinogalactan protein 26-like n=1 Tax=Durio zibethinus TaxID=66656 RepID=A0A6P6A064_DURZI|nr:classical arabinogalactan protein 26-like [Durio zibethinus]